MAPGPSVVQTTPPVKVQLALQGGGAKLYALLGALAEFRNYEDKGRILVTRIAGTSAGALAGLLYASRYPIRDIPERLNGTARGKLQRMLRLPAIPRRIWRVLNGTPLVDLAPIKEFIVDELENDAKRNHRTAWFKFNVLARESRVDLFVVATDLRDRTRVVYGPDRTPEVDVVGAVIDSISIPFVFRAARRGLPNLVVDGWLCENLPAKDLLADQDNYGQVISLTFLDDRSEVPASFLEMGSAILDAATRASTRHTRSLLPDAAVLELNTRSIRALDFDKVLDDQFSHRFSQARDQTRDFLDRYLLQHTSSGAVLPDELWSPETRQVLENINRLYVDLFKDTPFRYAAAILEVTAHCLGDGESDDFLYRLDIEPTKGQIGAWGVSIIPTNDSGRAFQVRHEGRRVQVWHVLKDGALEPVSTRYLPALSPTSPNDRRAIVFFTPGLLVSEPPERFRVEYEDRVPLLMGALKATGSDEMSLAFQRRDGKVGKVRLICHYPASAGTIFAAARGPQSAAVMTREELLEYPAGRDGYCSVGVKCDDFDADAVEIDLHLVPPR